MNFVMMNIDLSLSQNENNFDIFINMINASYFATVTWVEDKKHISKCRKDPDSSYSDISQRCLNCNKDDSILLAKAYKYSEEKKCRPTPEAY